MTSIDTVVIGAGHAGLAVSRLLSSSGRDHVVLDRGDVAERWRTERWDSLHLLTPSWMTRLPGWSYRGQEPEGYLSASGFVSYLEEYAASFDAPVQGSTWVEDVSLHEGRLDAGYAVSTSRGTWSARHVVVATGPWGRPRVPAGLERAGVPVVAASAYRNPGRLPPGGVLVVGASASGVQIADELARSGRDVVLAVGRHTRIPRHYRGMEIFWWLERTGKLARTIDDSKDPARLRAESSLQLIGRNGSPASAYPVDLAALQDRGVQLAGRFDGVHSRKARFRDDLAESVSRSDARLHQLLASIDDYVAAVRMTSEVLAAERPPPVPLAKPVTAIDLRSRGIASIVLATGYRPSFGWLTVPVLGADGSIQQRKGVTASPGLYVVGQPFQHRRDSGFIDGARHDAATVVAHLTRRIKVAASTSTSTSPAASPSASSGCSR
jgi:putative flavoprotein involved in K+ transport